MRTSDELGPALVVLALYFVPTWIAAARNIVSFRHLLIFNIIFGWVPFVWCALVVVAIYECALPPEEAPIEIVQRHASPGLRIEPQLFAAHEGRHD